MKDRYLSNLQGMEWMVAARNEIQSLMFRLRNRWDEMGSEHTTTRRAALGVAFSLWRAAFLLVEKEQTQSPEDTERLDPIARQFLERVIRTNAIGFGDDLQFRRWTGVYYVENAVRRIEATGYHLQVYGWSPSANVRDTWNEAFYWLNAIVAGTNPGTVLDGAPESGVEENEQ
jgi:hypothetical protein